MIRDHPDGIRLVELAALVDHDVFLDEVAQRFDAAGVDGEPMAQTIAEKIDDRQMLLVLDNCEQLVEPVARLTSDLLAACPNLRVIATSRERLAITGEVVYRVPSLSVPPDGIDVDRSLDYDSIRLFVERAQLSDPDFELLATNVDDVSSICRHLDGIPLAIELAAARVRSMSPQQIGSRLGERFRLLTGTDRSSDDRHQTLLSTIEWSHGLLEVPERVVFRRLGTFVSDFSLEAAEQVCAEGEIFEFDVVELLTALVDKSMVATTAGIDGTRYQLLESIRVYAPAISSEAGEHATAAERHARQYADLAAELQRRQRAGDLATALAVFDEEEDNFRASLRFAIDNGDAVLAARLVDGLGYLWYAGGVRREGLDWCESLFALEAELPDDVRAGALHSHALMLGGTGDHRTWRRGTPGAGGDPEAVGRPHPPRSCTQQPRKPPLRRRRTRCRRSGAPRGGRSASRWSRVRKPDAEQPGVRSAGRRRHRGCRRPLSTGPGRGKGVRPPVRHRRRLLAGIGEALTHEGRAGEARHHLVEARERFD